MRIGTMAICTIVFVCVMTAAQNLPIAQGKCSVSGVIRERNGGSPVAGAHVYALGADATQTDKQGYYQIDNLTPGLVEVHVYVHGPSGPRATKTVQMASGDAKTLDFLLIPKGTISGRVLDDKGEPSFGAEVFLVSRKYRLGSLRYGYIAKAETDDQGQYEIKNVDPGPGYLVEVLKRSLKLTAASDAPSDIKLRKRATVPTWYPDSDSMDGAQVITLQPGEHREGVDVRLKQTPSHCMDGMLATGTGPESLYFHLDEHEPTTGELDGGTIHVDSPSGRTDHDGRIRICDLHSGFYRLTAFDISGSHETLLGETDIAIGESDLHGVRVDTQVPISVSGELLWDGKPSDQASGIRVVLRPLTRAPLKQDKALMHNLPPLTVPGRFNLPAVLPGDYAINVMGLPIGTYLKGISYGGQNALLEPMHVGKTTGSDLRIILAKDGGTISARVADKDSNPMADCKVVLLPESASTDVAIADSMLVGQTDQYGSYSSGSIAPGKYYVLATNDIVDRTPECISRLLQARTHAQETELQPNKTVAVTVSPFD